MSNIRNPKDLVLSIYMKVARSDREQPAQVTGLLRLLFRSGGEQTRICRRLENSLYFSTKSLEKFPACDIIDNVAINT